MRSKPEHVPDFKEIGKRGYLEENNSSPSYYIWCRDWIVYSKISPLFLCVFGARYNALFIFIMISSFLYLISISHARFTYQIKPKCDDYVGNIFLKCHNCKYNNLTFTWCFSFFLCLIILSYLSKNVLTREYILQINSKHLEQWP